MEFTTDPELNAAIQAEGDALKALGFLYDPWDSEEDLAINFKLSKHTRGEEKQRSIYIKRDKGKDKVFVNITYWPMQEDDAFRMPQALIPALLREEIADLDTDPDLHGFLARHGAPEVDPRHFTGDTGLDKGIGEACKALEKQGWTLRGREMMLGGVSLSLRPPEGEREITIEYEDGEVTVHHRSVQEIKENEIEGVIKSLAGPDGLEPGISI